MPTRPLNLCAIAVRLFGVGLLVAIAALGLFGQSPVRPAPKAGAPRLLSLLVVPNEATIRGQGSSQRFLVLGEYADGLRRDLTADARWSLADSRIATVDSAGRVVGQAAGRTMLKAEVAGKSVKAAVTIEA